MPRRRTFIPIRKRTPVSNVRGGWKAGVSWPTNAKMKLAELLTVTDAFRIAGQGVLVMPDFPVPAASWDGVTMAAVVVRPDGSRLETQLRLRVTHFYRTDVPPERSWRLVPSFPDLATDDIPPGSHILAAEEVIAAIRGD